MKRTAIDSGVATHRAMRRNRDFERQMRLSVAQCLARGDYEIAEFQARKYFPARGFVRNHRPDTPTAGPQPPPIPPPPLNGV